LNVPSIKDTNIEMQAVFDNIPNLKYKSPMFIISYISCRSNYSSSYVPPATILVKCALLHVSPSGKMSVLGSDLYKIE